MLKNHLLNELFTLANNIEISPKACWILEECFLIDPSLYQSHLDRLSVVVSQRIDDSGRRAVLATFYHFYKKKGNRDQVSAFAKANLTNACLDTLISSDKTANLAYSAYILDHMGKDESWIADELHQQLAYRLERDAYKLGPGFKNAANKILRRDS